MIRDQNDKAWRSSRGDSPLVATAIHSGHSLRASIVEHMQIDEHQRLREQDPYTDEWTMVVPNRIVGTASRFEVDFNRPRDQAVYVSPQAAWGLDVWKRPLPESVIQESLVIYDEFYQHVREFLDDLTQQFDKVVVFDLHSYNHRRNGPQDPAADPEAHPEVNIGTGTMQRHRWASLVNRFMEQLEQFDFHGRQLDVRENVRFQGGHFPQWIHENYPDEVCVLSVEFKKFFMDEWTGQKDEQQTETIGHALASTVDVVVQELSRL